MSPPLRPRGQLLGWESPSFTSPRWLAQALGLGHHGAPTSHQELVAWAGCVCHLSAPAWEVGLQAPVLPMQHPGLDLALSQPQVPVLGAPWGPCPQSPGHLAAV